MNPLLATDWYKVGHVFQYPPKTQFVYSNFTPRKSYLPGIDHMVWFGGQLFNKYILINAFRDHFFSRSKHKVIDEYRRYVKNCLGSDLPTYQHIADLHDLGYLPIEIRSLAEGTKVPMRVPCMTIINTLPQFYWLTNAIETLMSTYLWRASTSATIAHEYYKKLTYWAAKTGMPAEFVQWQGHDFSFRGQPSAEAAMVSGMGHLAGGFSGTDTIPAIWGMEQFYHANIEKELVGGSVAATEHSVMCAGGQGNELETDRRLIEDVYPAGTVSVVSDTWDLWNTITNILPALKDKIMARDGKVVIRPDSGDPVKIICGDPDAVQGSPANKGVIQLLWDIFGGTKTITGHRLLDSHIGAIYGDSITLDRCEAICSRLHAKGFASQLVFGIGSFTYQYVTRDTFGCAIKATWVQIDGVGRAISKDPVTDSGTKKSASGLLKVIYEDGKLVLKDNQSSSEGGELITRFRDGMILNPQNLGAIRDRVRA